jgi:hypothetical protein
MRLESVRGLRLLFACVALSALVACGGDDEGSGGTGGPATGGTGGTTGGTGGDGSGGTAGTMDTGGMGGSGGGGMGGGGGGVALPMCTEEIPTTAVMCGGTACPMPMMFMGIDTCSRPCCVMVDGAETCGAKNANDAMPTECAPLPQPDTRCPNYMQGAMERIGCCTGENTCGIISTITNMCVTESPLVPTLPETPPSCDDAGGDDAGM